MDDEVTEYPTRRVHLNPCQFCGRQFNSDSLNKHQAVCRKTINKKRKVFDAGRQRALESDVSYKATRRTAQIYQGEISAGDEKSKCGSKSNWREKHRQLIRSIREARGVTRALKGGGPLPAFRPSEVPSDYVNCPYCHRNFNKHSGERHIPFCESQHRRKYGQNSRSKQQYDREQSIPSHQSTQYRSQQHSYSTSAYSHSHHPSSNGHKYSTSAPMVARRYPSDYQRSPLPSPRKTTTSGNGWGFRKLFGMNSKENVMPSSHYYAPEDDDDDDYRQPVLMRTGRTQANTSLNVSARQRSDDVRSSVRRSPPRSSYSGAYPSSGQARYQHDNYQYSSMRPSRIALRCSDCGHAYNNISARYCPQCGTRR